MLTNMVLEQMSDEWIVDVVERSLEHFTQIRFPSLHPKLHVIRDLLTHIVNRRLNLKKKNI